jgi:phospholipid/cholesterol/gamma-HCH transport system substrate-binding protein
MTTRFVAIGALVAAVIAVFVLVSGGSDYRITARFVDAGQLVKGGSVEVGGRTVGTIDSIRLSDNGLADLRLKISDDTITPLRRGTTARIRTVGLTGVANRFVELEPGPSTGDEIPSGGMLSTAETRGIVDLDVLLDALDPATRSRLQRIIRNGAQVFHGRADAANEGLAYLNPALFQSAQLAEELVYDRAALERLITDGATTVHALASRDTDITEGISSTATTLRAVASQREALADALRRAPALLNRPGGALGELRETVRQLRPALPELRRATPGLVAVLRELAPTSRQALPVVRQLNGLLPPLRDGLHGLPATRDKAVPALRSTVRTLITLMPVVDGLRPYTPEVVNGVISGLGARASGYFDANGHFARIQVNQPPNATAGLTNLPQGIGGFETHKTFRCPGGATEPADDKSNPYIEDEGSCDPGDDVGG